MATRHFANRLSALGVMWAVALTASSARAARPDATGDEYGRTYYLDGAGNWGYGVQEVTDGLRQAGYRGRVVNFRWSPTLNPALDQTIGRPLAHVRAKSLAHEIAAYARKYPGRPVNIITLSAGAGVAVWAAEAMEPPATINNLVLLGCSLSSDYDMTRALRNISGGVWVYYSRGDMILAGPVRALGTIDGKLGKTPAGLAGLHPKGLDTSKIHNVPWSSRYQRYGWTGTHTDCTSQRFVQYVLGPRHILPAPPSAAVASQPADEVSDPHEWEVREQPEGFHAAFGGGAGPPQQQASHRP